MTGGAGGSTGSRGRPRRRNRRTRRTTRPASRSSALFADRPAVGLLELVAVDVGDEAQVRLAAHRALVVDVDPDVLGRPDQLRVGVADVEAGERPAPEVAQDRPAGERVVRDAGHGGQCRGVTRRLREAVFGGPIRSARSGPASPTSRMLASIYRFDISCIESTLSLPPGVPRARARRSRIALRAAASRLRAEEAPVRDARAALGHLVRLAVPGAAPPRTLRRHRGGRRDRRRRHRPAFVPTGSLKGDLAAARVRRRPRPGRRTRKAYRDHRPRASSCSPSCSPTRPPTTSAPSR